VRGLVFLAFLPLVALGQTPEEIEFFEKKIRPVLAEKCYACHSAATAAMGELRLDTRAAVRQGGSRGAAVVPGDAAASVLLTAVSYKKIDLRMPPTGKLSDTEIADLSAWIELGAPDPREDRGVPAEKAPPEIDAGTARGFWSFQPVRDPAPPAVKPADWVRTPVDAFLLAKLDEQGLRPSSEADKRTLIRRLTFDLTGLPPTPEEIDSFLADRSPDAYKKLAERLLASPHYGERWARHWLDLVRFAETNGHEFDNEKLDAWRYRDWVIRAFNEDLPYDRFVKEQIAGDLMEPRLVSGGERYETPIGSGFYWLWEVLNSPTDSVQSRADRVDNQIDVFGKAFLGLTLACARCHDHKFDPIPTADYYSVAGVFHSTQMAEKCIDSRRRAAEIVGSRDSLTAIGQEMRKLLRESRLQRARRLDERLLEAAAELAARESKNNDAKDDAKDKDADAPKSLLEEALLEPSDPLYPFARLADASEKPYSTRLEQTRSEMAEWTAKARSDHPIWQERGDTLFEDFEKGFDRWRVEGTAFGDESERVHSPDQSLIGLGGRAVANSFSGGDEFVGTMTTGKFRMPSRWVHVRFAGTETDRRLGDRAKLRLTIVADDHRSAHAMADGSGRLRWKTMSMTKEQGRECYIEITDRSREGHIAVERIVFSDSQEAPPIAGPPARQVMALLKRGGAALEDLAAAYRDLAVELLQKTELSADEQSLLAALEAPWNAESASSQLTGAARNRYDELAARRARLRESLPPSAFAMSSIDVEPHNVRIHLRGSHKNLGEEVPRRALQVISDGSPFARGSGRLELAEWVGSENNPLTARVMVNRVWKQHFGQGLARTTDNFGKTGERPTHPDLLDYLASRFVESGWSVKSLHRLIVLSSAYRMDSRVSAKAAEIDPANKLLSHMPVRRLEAEAIRDAALAVAGTLKLDLYGRSVPPHISPYQDGRGKPKSGPLDGDGRRSIYIQARRNFLTPLFLAFDLPLPASTAGNRGVSAVPSQALMLLNNELIHQQAGEWARAEIRRSSDVRSRVESMFVRAYARPPTAAEHAEIADFLAEQRSRREGDEQAAWSDLAHVLFNSTEFIFVR